MFLTRFNETLFIRHTHSLSSWDAFSMRLPVSLNLKVVERCWSNTRRVTAPRGWRWRGAFACQSFIIKKRWLKAFWRKVGGSKLRRGDNLPDNQGPSGRLRSSGSNVADKRSHLLVPASAWKRFKLAICFAYCVNVSPPKMREIRNANHRSEPRQKWN